MRTFGIILLLLFFTAPLWVRYLRRLEGKEEAGEKQDPCGNGNSMESGSDSDEQGFPEADLPAFQPDDSFNRSIVSPDPFDAINAGNIWHSQYYD